MSSIHKKLSSPITEQFIGHYDACYSLVLSTVYSRIHNFHDAEDITQEVFIRFYAKMDEIENPRKWLFGCLRIVILDYYKAKHHKDVDIEEMFDDMSLAYVNGFRDTRIMLKNTLDEIAGERGDADAALFELISVYNYSFAEAGRQMGMGYKQARYRYRKMVSRFMEKMREKGIMNVEDLL
jgi:RNA polymerase sigma factor (sigma-70 family)